MPTCPSAFSRVFLCMCVHVWVHTHTPLSGPCYSQRKLNSILRTKLTVTCFKELTFTWYPVYPPDPHWYTLCLWKQSAPLSILSPGFHCSLLWGHDRRQFIATSDCRTGENSSRALPAIWVPGCYDDGVTARTASLIPKGQTSLNCHLRD